ncbi:MAG: hypothetical protein ACRCXX_07885 [Cetobacterium sp.]|uniref:hypothetical protein n=1 Tax=Cetobacterium sp. TaxID=2071632 RepID=UPI003F3A1CA3
MKKIYAFLLMMILSVASLAAVEASLTQDYSRSILTGATKKTAEKVRVMVVKEIPKLHDWDYIYGLEYQFKDKKNDQELIPQVGVRYYPVNVIPVYASATAGVEIRTEKNDYSPVAELGVGVGREGVIGGWYISLNERKQLATGIRLGYKFGE